MLKDLNSGKFIDVKEGKAENEVNIIIWEKNNCDNQKQKVIDRGNGFCSLQTKINPNFYLDVKYGGEGGENNVWLYEGNNTDAQIFKPIKKIIYKFRVGVKGLDNILLPEPITRSLVSPMLLF